MPNPKSDSPSAKPSIELSEMTTAQAAKLVKRTVAVIENKKPVFTKDGKARTKQVAVSADEVLAFREYDDHVVVVTNDGQKFKGDK